MNLFKFSKELPIALSGGMGMAADKPKLTFIANQARVRCEFTRQHCLNNPNGAEEIIERAKKRMRSEKKEGRVVFYRVFATRLRSMWNLMRLRDEPPETIVAVTVAAGAPELRGLNVEAAPAGHILGFMSINAPAEFVKKWKPYFVKLTVGRLLREAGIERIPNPVQIHRLLEHAALGRPVTRVPIQELPARVADGNGEGFQLFEDSSQQDVSIEIYNPGRMLERENVEKLIERLSEIRDRMNAKGSNYVIQFEEIIRSARSAARGPERYGLDLPMVLLAAFDKNRLQVSASQFLNSNASGKSSQNTQKSSKSQQLGSGTGQPSINFNISTDGMEAKILKFDPAWYSQYSDVISLQWLMRTAEQFGIRYGIDETIQLQLKEMIDKRHSIEGMVIARGQMPEDGKEPYFHKTYLDTVAVDPDANEVVALRDRQRHGFVNAGQEIGEIRFKVPSKDKITVRGQVTASASPKLENYGCGDGVQQIGNRYIATVDGVPLVDETSVTITKGLVHEGSVNLSTGNVHFQGDVTINGNVEQGAVINVQGNVTVTGSIVGGDVRVEGNLSVAGGINGTAQGKAIFVTGDLSAGFIENSKVKARGNVVVQSSILTSVVHSGGTVDVMAKEGLIVGSQIYAEIGLSTGNFGRANGATTEAFLGCCYSMEASHRLKTERTRKLSELIAATELKIRQLEQRPEQQKTNNHRAEEAALKVYLERVSKLMNLSEQQAIEAKERVKPNKEASAKIREVLSPGSRFVIAGKKFVAREPVAGVTVRLHSGVVKIEALDENESSKAEEKKAS